MTIFISNLSKIYDLSWTLLSDSTLQLIKKIVESSFCNVAIAKTSMFFNLIHFQMGTKNKLKFIFKSALLLFSFFNAIFVSDHMLRLLIKSHFTSCLTSFLCNVLVLYVKFILQLVIIKL